LNVYLVRWREAIGDDPIALAVLDCIEFNYKLPSIAKKLKLSMRQVREAIARIDAAMPDECD
jgi:hypothetical protein